MICWHRSIIKTPNIGKKTGLMGVLRNSEQRIFLWITNWEPWFDQYIWNTCYQFLNQNGKQNLFSYSVPQKGFQFHTFTEWCCFWENILWSEGVLLSGWSLQHRFYYNSIKMKVIWYPHPPIDHLTWKENGSRSICKKNEDDNNTPPPPPLYNEVNMNSPLLSQTAWEYRPPLAREAAPWCVESTRPGHS